MKVALEEMIAWPLKYPKLFNSSMSRKGALLSGPPVRCLRLHLGLKSLSFLQGTGKTLIAKAVAKESEHPRAYEVAATLIKSLADMNKDLLDLQKKRKDLSPNAESAKTLNVDKAVFVGSTTELVKFLKHNK